MANMRKRDGNASPTWQVRWRQNGKGFSETFSSEAGAVKFRGMVDAAGQHYPEDWIPEVGIVKRAVEPPLAGPPLLEWFGRSVGSRPRANPRTRADYSRDFRLHVPPWLAQKPIETITREDVGRWLIELQEKKLSAKSIHNIHGTVSSVMKDAQADDLIRRNPFLGQTRAIPIRHEEMVFLTPGEYQLFREFVIEHYRPFIDFLFTTGLRFSEATALLPQHVDLAQGRLHVVTAWKRQPDYTFVSQEPKSAGGRRTLSLTARQVDVITDLIRPGELIFRNKNGGRIHQNSFHSHTWQPALKVAAKAGFTKRPRPHDLRHSHAAYLLSINQPMLAVSRRLGHASIQITNDRYGHLLPEVDLSMVSAMDSIGY